MSIGVSNQKFNENSFNEPLGAKVDQNELKCG